MSVGDLANNLKKLNADLRTIRYPAEFDMSEAAKGEPAVFLPVIHHILLGNSDLLQRHLAESGIDLYVKSDRQFIGAVYKLLILVFRYKPVLSQTQFFDLGFAEHKVLLCLQLIKLCEKKTNDLLRLDAAQRSRKQRVTTPTKRLEYVEPAESWNREARTNTSGASVRVFESPEVPPRLNSAHPFYAHTTDLPRQDEYHPPISDTAPSVGIVLRQLSQTVSELKQDVQQIRSDFDTFCENVNAHLALLDNQIRMIGKQKNEELLEYALSRASPS